MKKQIRILDLLHKSANGPSSRRGGSKKPEFATANEDFLETATPKLGRAAIYARGLLALLFIVCSACFSSSERPPKDTSQARLNVPTWGVVVDANYDKKLDGLVPGYKVVTVALSNRGVDTIKLDPVKDEWVVEDAWGKKQKGIYSLRISDAKAWAQLPSKVKDIIEYPAGVQVGFTQTFDLFFSEKVDLYNFRSISFYSASLKKNFDALSSSSLDRAVPSNDHTPSEVPDKLITPSHGSKMNKAKDKK
ncbi:MAG: hypothetical protein HQM15_06465 [Deltaproteobacteria bacterium]|nr:hypothetical protein [Deltaproteobacteria bacterium]